MTDGFQDYFRPIDAAKALGIDPERIRDRVLWFDHEPERFPLYYKLTRSYHAHWMLDPELEHPEHSGPTKGETELGAGRCFAKPACSRTPFWTAPSCR